MKSLKFSMISWNYWKSGPKITLFYWSLNEQHDLMKMMKMHFIIKETINQYTKYNRVSKMMQASRFMMHVYYTFPPENACTHPFYRILDLKWFYRQTPTLKCFQIAAKLEISELQIF